MKRSQQRIVLAHRSPVQHLTGDRSRCLRVAAAGPISPAVNCAIREFARRLGRTHDPEEDLPVRLQSAKFESLRRGQPAAAVRPIPRTTLTLDRVHRALTLQCQRVRYPGQGSENRNRDEHNDPRTGRPGFGRTCAHEDLTPGRCCCELGIGHGASCCRAGLQSLRSDMRNAFYRLPGDDRWAGSARLADRRRTTVAARNHILIHIAFFGYDLRVAA